MENKSKKIIFFSLLILILYSKYLLQKFKNKSIKIQNIKYDTKIPKIIHCTYYNKYEIPQKVWDNLKLYAKDYEIRFYDNNDCYNFIKDNYNIQYANKFKSLHLGCHKADFFRYCVMYCKGGIYIDIKIQPKKNFNEIFDHTREKLFYTCLGDIGEKESTLKKYIRKFYGYKNGHIFQAILASYPGNKLFETLINDFFIINNPHMNYHIFTYRFYDHLYDLTNYHLYVGKHTYNDQEIILFKEINEKINENDIRDRHGGYYYVVDNNKEILFRSRYIDFPWNEKNIINEPMTNTIIKVINFNKIYKYVLNQLKNNNLNNNLLLK